MFNEGCLLAEVHFRGAPEWQIIATILVLLCLLLRQPMIVEFIIIGILVGLALLSVLKHPMDEFNGFSPHFGKDL